MKEGEVIAFTQGQLAKKLGVSTRTIRNWRRIGGLRSLRIGKRVLIRPKDLSDFFDRHVESGPLIKKADSLEGLLNNIVESVK